MNGSRKGRRGQVAAFGLKHFTISKPQPYKALRKLHIEVEEIFNIQILIYDQLSSLERLRVLDCWW